MKLNIEWYQQGQENIIATLHNEGFSEWIASVGMYYGYKKMHAEDVALWLDSPVLLTNIVLVELEMIPVAYAHICIYLDGTLKIGSFHDVGCCEYNQSELAVIPRYRRRGIGTALLQHCITFFNQHDVDEVRIYVYSDNLVARKFLDQQDFHHTGVDVILAEIDLTKELPVKNIDTPANIRTLDERDAVKLLEFSQEAEGEDIGIIRASTVDEARAYILRDDTEVEVVAELEGKIVGCFGAEKHTGHLGLNVHPEYRQRGIGSALMYNLLRILRERGYVKALTDSEANRIPAHALYKKFGFQEMRRRECWVKSTSRVP